MAEGTKIEWTHRPGTIPATMNALVGCQKVSQGCAHCYAIEVAHEISFCRCPSCSSGTNGWDRFTGLMAGHNVSTVNVCFCPGGKAPTEQRGMMAAMITGEQECFNPCAGVTEPHLHVQCRGCGYEWLMRTKQAHL